MHLNSTKRSESRNFSARTFPSTGPAPSVERALLSSRTELRAIERLLLSCNPHSSAGLLVAQLGLLFLRLERGAELTRGEVVGLLALAAKVTDHTGAGDE